MRRKLLPGLALVCVLSVFALAPDDRVRAENTRDGAYWNRLDDTERTDLVIGIMEGLNLSESILHIILRNEYSMCSDILTSIARQTDVYFEGMTVGRIVERLNAFYIEAQNRGIPISWGVWVVVRQDKRDRTVGKFLQELRALYH
ncbi:hypothetical protein [Desulfolutivibrio sulfoxidireducens]|uniref:hypothetical protein n=1 Tax=Desulfolutivibrio sulfoxidireducens TaxID=2773299 RepID=UPI00159E8A16|nr:hypothetical protein [Desulfolutivibrio sulfoxidireducens]QLA17099.1 hypothetical protein GD605_13855 [Desulfolutivibrio sulfoxidireducens]